MEINISKWLATFGVLLLSVGMICYFETVYKPAIAKRIGVLATYGNWSDLFPRWYGAQQLWLRGRNPYGPDVTREIQQGFYGRQLGRPGDPWDQQAFAYPIHTVLLLAPTARFSFESVRVASTLLLLFLTLISVPLWFRAFGLHASREQVLLTCGVVLSSLQIITALDLQQITLFVAALFAAAFAALTYGRFTTAGILFSMATIKPQLCVLPMIWLACWTLGDWKFRSRLAYTFVLACSGFYIFSEWIFPNWVPAWINSLSAYIRYTPPSLLESVAGRYASALALAMFILFLAAAWKARSDPLGTARSNGALAAAFVITVLTVRGGASYNQILLLPAILVIFSIRPTNRIALLGYRTVAALVLLQYGVALLLVILKFFEADLVNVYFPSTVAKFFPVIVYLALFVASVPSIQAPMLGHKSADLVADRLISN